MGYFDYLKETKLGKITLVLWIAVVALVIMAVYRVHNYLPAKFFLIGIVVAVVLILFTWLFHYKTPKFSAVLSVILIAALVFGNITLAKVNTTTAKITKNASTETETVYVACLKDSNISEDDDFSEYKMGYVLTDDTAYERSAEVLNENDKTVKRSKPFKTANAVYKSLKRGNTQLIYLTPSVLAAYDESDVDYDSEFKILFSKDYPLEKITTKEVDVTKETYTIYVQGVDASSSTAGSITSTGRGDCNLLITINPVSNKVNIQSVPRDLKVYIPNKDVQSKLSYSAWWGGVQASIASLEDYFGIDINYYAKLNFAGLTTLIDQLGGVNVWSDYDFDLEFYDGVHIHQGFNYLENGEEGLAFARERHSLPENAQSRAINHVALLKGIFRKFAENPSYNSAMNLLDSISKNFTTNVPESNFKDIFNTIMIIMPDIINDKTEVETMEGTIEWNTDPVTGVYKRYFIPSEGEKKAVVDRINAVIDSSKDEND